MSLTRKERNEKIRELKAWIEANGEEGLVLTKHCCRDCKHYILFKKEYHFYHHGCEKHAIIDTRHSDSIAWNDKRLSLKTQFPLFTLKRFEALCLHWEKKEQK